MPNSENLQSGQLLSNKYIEVREASITITEPLSEQDMQIQSMPEASPTKWHLGHTSWAFETFILKPFVVNYKEFDPQFEYLFNSYYNAIGKQFPRAQRGMLSRPSCEEVLNYRQHVDKAMLELLKSRSALQQVLVNLVKLLINHEQQHQELMLTDIKHALFINPDFPVYRQTTSTEYPKSNLDWCNYHAGLYKIGHNSRLPKQLTNDLDSFYFDNEAPQHQVYLQPFKIASRLVSNGEYLEFVKSGGYEKSSFWLSEAWAKIQQQNITMPFYWVNKQDRWYQYTFSGLQPLDLNAPVMHINYFEASAYANSKNLRLPTEQEWEVASHGITVEGHFFNPTNMQPTSTSENKIEQMFGELWQWTSSSYNAYPGFKTVDGAIGEYNGKFMVNQYVLRGGSIVTPQGHIRPTYRNFFYPDASWQCTGIRLADNL